MSDITWDARIEKGHTLLIVEGHHEKDNLFNILFKCFPELKINSEQIHIYGTNIYQLYNKIVNEYGCDWDSNDINIPLLIERETRDNLDIPLKKYKNIFLIFDYERHDPCFSEDKICRLQKYFNDSSDNGKLFLNYPMVESYLHFDKLPDFSYSDRVFKADYNRGHEYKNLVKDSFISKCILLPQKINDILTHKYGLHNNLSNIIVYNILNLASNETLYIDIEKILSIYISTEDFAEMCKHFEAIIRSCQYISYNISFFCYMRKLFKEITIHNICKANKIQHNVSNLYSENLEYEFSSLDMNKILEIQNHVSGLSQNAFIWVLNTCVFLVPDFNFSLIKD